MHTKDPLLGTVIYCQLCGEDEKLAWMPHVNQNLKDRSLCFSCNHMMELYTMYECKAPAFIIDGVHYIAHPDEPNKRFSGFGGQRFIIATLADGKITETGNLWCQGDVPKHMRSFMPDTAQFVDTNYKWIERDGLKYLVSQED